MNWNKNIYLLDKTLMQVYKYIKKYKELSKKNLNQKKKEISLNHFQ